jgi:hypothetical protein
MPFEGDIEDFPITGVLQVVGQSRKTGTLAIEGERDTIWVYFKDGRAIFATPSNQREKLGAILLRDGLITEEQLEKSLSEQQESRTRGDPIRLGAVLVRMDAIDRQTLERKITEQIKESIYAAVGEKRGKFRFFPGLDLSDEDILVSVDVNQVILEGGRRIEEWEQVRRTIRSYHEVYAINPNPASDGGVQLTPREWRVLSMLNGERDIAAIAEETGLGRFEVSRILYVLLNMNIIRPIGPLRFDRPARGGER